jgi:hypothetical protein
MSTTPHHSQTPGPPSEGARFSTASRWQREPLLHFLLLGAVLYAASLVFAPAHEDLEIVIDSARVNRLAQLYELQTGAAPSSAQRDRLVEDFVRDEVLYREARKLGLGEGDELVRRRLVQKMAFLQASVKPVEPTDAQLRAFHKEHAAQFTAPSRLSFVHVYFSPDGRGSDAARAAAEIVLRRHFAANGAMPSGDRPPVPGRFENATPDDLRLAFGQRPIVEGLMQAPPGQWVGPLESGYGWHLVRVTERAQPVPVSLDLARDAVTAAWRREERLQAERARDAALLRRYNVVRTDQNTTTR